MASSLRGVVLSFVLIAAVAVTLAQDVNDKDFSIGTTNQENGLAKQGNVTVLANSTDSNTPAPAANATAPANATATTNTTEANNATADANSTAIANSSNITLPTIEPQWWMNLSEFSMPPDLLSENNTEVRTFQSQIPIVEATNETDPSNASAIADTITKVNILIKFDLVHKFKGGHGIYFRHKMWTHLLEELRKGLAYLKRVLQARIAARDGEAVKLKLALTRVSNALRRIKELKAQHEALGVDLTILRKMATMMSNKNLSERLRVELHDAEKIASDRHLEAKKARETVLGARNRLDKALKRFVAVIQRVVGKFVYSQQVMELLNPIHDYGLQSALDLMRHSIKTKKAQITQIEALVDSATTDAIRVRGSEFNLRSQQVTHFTDEVLQEQRKVALYTKLLAQARDRLKEIDTNTTVTPVASS